MSSHAYAWFAASDSSEATTKIDHEDEKDPAMEDTEEGAVMFLNYFIHFSPYLIS